MFDGTKGIARWGTLLLCFILIITVFTSPVSAFIFDEIGILPGEDADPRGSLGSTQCEAIAGQPEIVIEDFEAQPVDDTGNVMVAIDVKNEGDSTYWRSSSPYQTIQIRTESQEHREISIHPDPNEVIEQTLFVRGDVDEKTLAAVTPNDIVYATPRHHIEETEFDTECKLNTIDDNNNPYSAPSDVWTLPPRPDSSSLSGVAYADLWYSITGYPQGALQRQVIRTSIALDEEIGQRGLVEIRYNNTDELTLSTKKHTSVWNQELPQIGAGDKLTDHIYHGETSQDSPVITNVGIELISVDPHTIYKTGSGVLTNQTTHKTYINREPTVTAAVADPIVDAQETDYGSGDPAESKTTYEIVSGSTRESTYTYIVANGTNYTKRYNDTFNAEGSAVKVKEYDITDKTNTTYDDNIWFNASYYINTTEREQDWGRSCSTDKEGNTECTDWEKEGPPEYNNYSVKVKDKTRNHTLYDPFVNVSYTAANQENLEQSGMGVEMMVNNTYNPQPISAFSPQAETDPNLNDDRVHTVQYPIRFYSIADPQYKNNLGELNIQPVEHYAIPTGTKAIPRGEYRDTTTVTSTNGSQLPAPDIQNVRTVDGPQHAIEPTETTSFTEYPTKERFDRSQIEVQPLVPNTPVETEVTETHDIRNVSYEYIDLSVNLQSIPIFNYSNYPDNRGPELIEVTTDNMTGDRINTKEYNNISIRVYQGGELVARDAQTETVETTNGEIDGFYSKQIQEPYRPTTIKAEFVNNRNKSNVDKVLIGETEIRYLEARNSPSDPDVFMTILTRIIRVFLWYFLPAIILLALITKAFKGRYIPYDIY